MSKISAIIFDLGGVILNINQELTLRAFSRLGINLDDVNESHTIFKEYETGKISSAEFVRFLHHELKGQASEEQIIAAWNKMLLDLPSERLLYLNQLRKKYNVYLLSNTNELHIQYFHNYLDQDYGTAKWQDLFDHIFLSYEVGLRKPGKEIYEHVLNQTGFGGDQCIFIDDSKANLKGAEEAGIKTLWAKEPLSLALMEELKSILH